MIAGFYLGDADIESWRSAFRKHAPDIEFRVWPDWPPYEEIDYALVWAPPPELLKACRHLKAIFSLGAGVDCFLAIKEHMPAGVPLIRMADRGLIERMTEYIVLNVLIHHRRLLDYQEQQRNNQWLPISHADAEQTRIGFMGLGNMASPAVDFLLRLGFPVSAWVRKLKSIEGVRTFAGKEEFSKFLSQTDILVSILPATEETDGILNKETLALLPSGAALINAGRGQVLIEEDLLDAIVAGHLRGASLDVFSEEPLPEGHPLWCCPEVIITPHTASLTMPETAVEYIAEVINQIEKGERPQHMADLSRGY